VQSVPQAGPRIRLAGHWERQPRADVLAAGWPGAQHRPAAAAARGPGGRQASALARL